MHTNEKRPCRAGRAFVFAQFLGLLFCGVLVAVVVIPNILRKPYDGDVGVMRNFCQV